MSSVFKNPWDFGTNSHTLGVPSMMSWSSGWVKLNGIFLLLWPQHVTTDGSTTPSEELLSLFLSHTFPSIIQDSVGFINWKIKASYGELSDQPGWLFTVPGHQISRLIFQALFQMGHGRVCTVLVSSQSKHISEQRKHSSFLLQTPDWICYVLSTAWLLFGSSFWTIPNVMVVRSK